MGAVTRPKRIGYCDAQCFTTREKRVLASVRASVGRPRSRKERLEAIPIRGQHRPQLVLRLVGPDLRRFTSLGWYSSSVEPVAIREVKTCADADSRRNIANQLKWKNAKTTLLSIPPFPPAPPA